MKNSIKTHGLLEMKQISVSYFAVIILAATPFLTFAQTREVCGEPTPANWITISVDGLCNGATMLRTIQRIDNLPSGHEMVICMDAVPQGWVTLEIIPGCGHYFNTYFEGRRIKKVTGLPSGTTLTICGDYPLPANYVTVDIGLCRAQGSIITIRGLFVILLMSQPEVS